MKDMFPIPPEPELEHRMVIPEMEHYATALGYVCHQWANLEWTTDRFIQTVLECSEDQRRCIATAAGQLPARCRFLVQILYTRRPLEETPAAGEPGWMDATERLLGYIQNDLSKQRNRFVHDRWNYYREVRQVDVTARLGKMDSHSSKTVMPEKEIARDLQDVWNLHRDIMNTNTLLSYEHAEYHKSEHHKRPAAPSPQLVRWYAQKR